ncbi:MAG: isocitrate/isopropylmalate family dehydrogenase [Pseudomonadota bacterium]
MTAREDFVVAVLPGDGIGPEVMAPCLDILGQAQRQVGGFTLTLNTVEAGAAFYAVSGESIPSTSLDHAQQADAILLAAMGLPSVRYPDGTEIAPQLELREQLGLYAGVRPIRTLAGLPLPLADRRGAHLDAVLIRESTEGLFAARGKTSYDGDKIARDTMVITRSVCERLFDFAFHLARERKESGAPGRVTCIDKANVLGGFAFFRKIFLERAELFPDIETDCAYVDAMALNLVKRPWDFDVMVTENMFGDILSDLGAALMGGMGLAPSADIGDDHAVFQPCHGSAPDIVGLGKANPTAMILSAAMMLEWLGARHDNSWCVVAGSLIRASVGRAFSSGVLLPFELGGAAGTDEIVACILEEMQAVDHAPT